MFVLLFNIFIIHPIYSSYADTLIHDLNMTVSFSFPLKFVNEGLT